MHKLIIFLFITLNISIVKGQTQNFIDSLLYNNENELIVFKTNCVGCLVQNEPCEDYVQNGNPWNLFVIWKNSKGYHIRKFNNCGSSDVITLRNWKTDPFKIVSSNTTELDTTELKYPLTYNHKDSTWFETGINHYKYYELSFPTYNVSDLHIKDYAFREPKNDSGVFNQNNEEYKRNENRYAYNRMTTIKKLLDSLLSTIEKKEKKLEIIN